ncbi:MAG: efflux RND transporter periplasmic adaptor subunit [bacterium]|nr:efflux RND transporter periplasmic adaptor subunit [bacterium]
MAKTNAIRNAGLALVMAVAVAVAGCGKQDDTAQRVGKDVRAETTQARQARIPRLVTATGSLEPERTVMVSTRMMGWVTRIHVQEGQTVAEGDPLVSIDDTDLRARKSQAEAGVTEAEAVLANAQKNAERFQRLYEEKSVSKQQLDDVLTGRDRAAAGVEMARAGLREVEVHLSYLDITAPSGGVVARRMVEEGDMANPGMPLISLEHTGRIKVVAHLGERDVTSVAEGDTLTVDVTSLEDAIYRVPIARVITAANPGSRTYDIEACLGENSDGRLRSGMFARVSVPVGERDAVLVPEASIVRRGQLAGVWVVDEGGIVHLRWIRLGHPVGEDVEVIAGLGGDETIVLSATAPLVEGDKVVNES